MISPGKIGCARRSTAGIKAAKLLAESLAERGRYGESLLLKITLTENPVERLFSEPSAVPAYSLEEAVALWLPACYVYPAGIDCSEALRLNRGAIFEGGEEFYRAGFNPAGSYCNLDWYWLLKRAADFFVAGDFLEWNSRILIRTGLLALLRIGGLAGRSGGECGLRSLETAQFRRCGVAGSGVAGGGQWFSVAWHG